jgi:hypothetical protein
LADSRSHSPIRVRKQLAGSRRGRVPWSGGIEGVVVNLSDVLELVAVVTSSAAALLTSLGLTASSPVWVSLAIEPSDR